jgi:RNA polymerase sigma factor for flagellar operon FliA
MKFRSHHVHRQRSAGPELDAEAVQRAGSSPGAPDDRQLPANVEIDDLIQVGMIGLTDALSRFDAAQGVQFETFATQRIRGAMLDELRGNDYLSRGTRKHQRSIESAVSRLEQQLGRAPQESEIANEMGIGLPEYQELLGKVRGTQLVYLEDMSGAEGDSDFLDRHVADTESNPLAQLQDQRMRGALIEAIKVLPEREQYVDVHVLRGTT